MSLLKLEKAVRKELGISKANKVFYVESMEHLNSLRPTMSDEAYESAINPNTRGLASNRKYAYIFLFKMTGVQMLDREFVLCHELRHLWQFENDDFEMSSDFMPYSLKAEEIDANDWAHKRLSVKTAALTGVYIAIQIGAGLGLGLLAKKVIKKIK